MVSTSGAGGSLPGTSPSRGISRRQLLIYLGAGTVVLTGGGVAALQLIKSPQQHLADSQAPDLSVLTAPVEFRVLVDTVVLRGMVGAGSSVDVTPMPIGVARAVLTGVKVNPGAEFGNGAVLVEVSGRPLIALLGAIPAYRDLLPGMSGQDVKQLQQALKSLGHNPGPVNGTFNASTKQALTSLYRKLGYEVATTGDTSAITAANQQVTAAQRALDEAEKALQRLKDNPPPTPGPGEPDPVAEAEQAVRYAREDLDAAKAARDEVVRTTGAMLPLSEVVFLPAFPARVEKLNATVGTEVNPPLLTLSTGALVVRAFLNPAQQRLLREQMPVEILAEMLGITVPGIVSSIGELTQDQQTGERGYPMTVTPTDGPLDEKLNGVDVRLTVRAASTDGKVLVVPISAVFSYADARTSVLKIAAGGTQQRVVVTPGVSGDGYIEVTPVEGTLAPGDLVVIGSGRQP